MKILNRKQEQFVAALFLTMAIAVVVGGALYLAMSAPVGNQYHGLIVD